MKILNKIAGITQNLAITVISVGIINSAIPESTKAKMRVKAEIYGSKLKRKIDKIKLR